MIETSRGDKYLTYDNDLILVTIVILKLHYSNQHFFFSSFSSCVGNTSGLPEFVSRLF